MFFFHYGKLHTLLKLGAMGHTQCVCVYTESSCSNLVFIVLYSLILSLFLWVYFLVGLFSGSGGKALLIDTDVETGKLTHMIKKAHRLDKLLPYFF